MRSIPAVTLLLSLFGCAPPLPEVTVVTGAPAAGPQAARSTLGIGATPVALGALSGAAAVGTGAGVLVFGDDGFEPVPLAADVGEPTSTGAVRLFTPRATGVLVLAEQGLFHDRAGKLLRAPLSASLDLTQVQSLDAWGSGETEELWLRTSTGLLHVSAGTVAAVSLSGVTGPIDVAVGAGPGLAVIAAQGSLWLSDVTAGTASPLALNIGAAHHGARGGDGTVYVATSTGLYARAPQGALSRITFAAPGSPAADVSAVVSGEGALAALSAGRVLLRGEAGYSDVGPLAGDALALDAAGDVWGLESALAVRLATGKPVAFADVRPFFDAHCQSCHRTGTSGAPTIDFDDYPTAQRFGAVALKRLRSDGLSPMPPANVETLAEQDYAVVARWVAGGMKP